MTTTPPKVKYTINRDTDPIQVLRAQENETPALIATVSNGNISIVAGCERFESVIKRRLKESGVPYGDTVSGMSPVAADVEVEPKIAAAHRTGDERTGLEGIEDLDVRAAVAWLRKKQDMPVIVETPAPKPPKIEGTGDKTPAYVEHLLRYDPATFAKKYGVLGMGNKVSKETYIDPESKSFKKREVKERGVVTQRKTHITLANDRSVKLEAN